MATSDPDMVDEVRDFAQYKQVTVSDSELGVAVNRAKSHLLSEVRLADDDVDWYNKDEQEEALFWASMLFSKVQTGALDSQSVSVGAITESALVANGDEVTTWFREYKKSRNKLAVNSGGGNRTVRSGRTTIGGDRQYTKEEL